MVRRIGMWALAMGVSGAIALASGEVVYDDGYDVRSSGVLTVDVSDADVRLRTGEGRKVKIRAELSSNDMALAQQRFDGMNLRSTLSSNRVTVRSDDSQWNEDSGPHRFHLVVEIEHPEEFHVDVRTKDGDVQVEKVRGSLSLLTRKGDIRVGIVDAPEVLIETEDGDVQVDTVVATKIKIKTGDGDIEAERLDANQTTVHSADGDIVVGEISGSASISTRDGDIRIGIGRFDGLFTRTVDGDVEVQAPSDIRANLDLRGEEVALRRLVEFSGHHNERGALGTIHGGGAPLKAVAQDGQVTLTMKED